MCGLTYDVVILVYFAGDWFVHPDIHCIFSMLLMYMLLSFQVIKDDKLESELETVRKEAFPHVCPTPDEACEVPVEYLTPSPQIKVTIDNFERLNTFIYPGVVLLYIDELWYSFYHKRSYGTVCDYK